MAECRKKPPIVTITEGVAFFLSGGFLIGTSTSVNSSDILIQRLTPVTHVTGYVLLLFGFVYVLPLIPWFNCIQAILDRLAIYVYPLVFGITSLQVLQIALDPKQNCFLRWASTGFVVLIIGLIMFAPSGKVTNKARLLLSLVLTYNGLTIVIIAVRAENLLALTQSPNVEPLVLLIVSFICGLLLYAQIVKKES